MRKLLLGAAALITTLGLTAGVTAAQTGGGTIEDTGPDSSATIRTKVKTDTYVKNKNRLNVSNTTSQTAWSGNATVDNNNEGGDAESGEANNNNSFNASATVNNNSAGTVAAALTNAPGSVGGGTISNTGPDSDATVRTKVQTSTTVRNYNNLTVTNNTNQSAYSGDATVSNNTEGGNATSGDATNTNSASITLNVSN